MDVMPDYQTYGNVNFPSSKQQQTSLGTSYYLFTRKYSFLKIFHGNFKAYKVCFKCLCFFMLTLQKGVYKQCRGRLRNLEGGEKHPDRTPKLFLH